MAYLAGSARASWFSMAPGGALQGLVAGEVVWMLHAFIIRVQMVGASTAINLSSRTG